MSNKWFFALLILGIVLGIILFPLAFLVGMQLILDAKIVVTFLSWLGALISLVSIGIFSALGNFLT